MRICNRNFSSRASGEPSIASFGRRSGFCSYWILTTTFVFCTFSYLCAQGGLGNPGPMAPVAPASNPQQAPQQGGPAAGSSSSSGAAGSKKSASFLGKDVPFFNPGTEIFEWDGKHWNINDNRVFQARFEKYLNAPEETTEQDKAYQTLIWTILRKLAPENLTTKNLDEAFLLLPKASAYDIDAHLCDSLADAVYSAWRAQDAVQRLEVANEGLEQERKQNEWNAKMAAQSLGLDAAPGKNKDVSAQWAKEQQLKRDMEVQPYITRLAEITALIKANQAKTALNKLQTKIEFQALIVQFFMQRRFQHVLMATRFYRAVFSDGDTKLQVGKDAKNFFENGSGMPPTVGTLDSLANEAIRDVKEGVDAYTFLLQKGELESATKRLGEAFIIGEYMPEIRTLPRDQKRQALVFAQKSNRLISAIDVRDYTLADSLVKDLEGIAKDFDSSQPRAAIETAKTVSAMHLAKAKNAAVSGDRTTLETELREATELWPRNPALAEVSGLIFSQADVQQQAIIDLKQLLSQRNYRQIYDDKLRFIAASALYPELQAQLKSVLEKMQDIEGTIVRCNEIAKRGDYCGAWEGAEMKYSEFPDDTKLNQLRADLTTRASDFVHCIRTAQQLEEKGQTGSSLAWYLKAQKLYPPSEISKEGVNRLVQQIVPGK